MAAYADIYLPKLQNPRRVKATYNGEYVKIENVSRPSSKYEIYYLHKSPRVPDIYKEVVSEAVTLYAMGLP